MIPGFSWEVPARITGWHDGDTCYADLYMPPGLLWGGKRVRLLELYCPEIDEPEPGAQEALAFAVGLCPPGTVVKLRTRPLPKSGLWSTSTNESLGRPLCWMTLPDGSQFRERMIAVGLGWPTHVSGSGDGIAGLDHR